MMRLLEGHVHNVNSKIIKLTSKKQVLKIRAGLKWLWSESNV
jgi:hypothetical protein